MIIWNIIHGEFWRLYKHFPELLHKNRGTSESQFHFILKPTLQVALGCTYKLNVTTGQVPSHWDPYHRLAAGKKGFLSRLAFSWRRERVVRRLSDFSMASFYWMNTACNSGLRSLISTLNCLKRCCPMGQAEMRASSRRYKNRWNLQDSGFMFLELERILLL
jgi:hypothetical protein